MVPSSSVLEGLVLESAVLQLGMIVLESGASAAEVPAFLQSFRSDLHTLLQAHELQLLVQTLPWTWIKARRFASMSSFRNLICWMVLCFWTAACHAGKVDGRLHCRRHDWVDVHVASCKVA